MSWRTVATVFIVLFVATSVWVTLSDPLEQTGDEFKDVDEPSDHIDVDARIDEMTRAFGNMFLVLIFGVMAWGAWRVYRRELTRGRRP